MSMVENPYPLGGDFAEAWGEGAAAERERIVKALRDHAESFAGSPYKLNAAAYRMAADHIEGTRFDADERSAPSPSPPEPAPDEPACTCARRDPDDLAAGYEMCPAHAVAAVREAAAAKFKPDTSATTGPSPSLHGREPQDEQAIRLDERERLSARVYENGWCGTCGRSIER